MLTCVRWIASGELLRNRALSPVLCGDLEEGGGAWGAREGQEGGDMQILRADSRACAAET